MKIYESKWIFRYIFLSLYKCAYDIYLEVWVLSLHLFF